jgi:hypothetical protein
VSHKALQAVRVVHNIRVIEPMRVKKFCKKVQYAQVGKKRSKKILS